MPDVCKTIGKGCKSGDECCGGFCVAVGEFGEPVCSDTPKGCAAEYDACETAADCCRDDKALACIGGRCSQQVILQ